ncbi:MAG: hypothetical protein JOZ96_01230 [Acidobacteria bacterium]|nr:hypothetical protein [Acidobacteriota bacterium]MBV9923633.1 hypothetical protein [Acidobacteriota bacterium]
MSRRLCLTLTLAFVASLAGFAGGAAGASPEPQATPTPAPDAITFHNNTMADFSATSGEPIVKVDPRDRIFATSPFGVSTTLSLLWRSDDGGRSYRSMGTPVTRDAVNGPGGGDTDVDFDAKGRVYYVDLSAACVTAAVSEDGGQTFAPERTNYVTCVSDETDGAAVDDRQWVAGFGDGRGFVTWRNFEGGGFYMFRTRDGGLTWDKGRQLGSVSQSGPLKADKTKRRVKVNGVERDAILLYQIYYSGSSIRMFRVTDLDDGSEPIVEDKLIYNSTSGSVNNVFPVISVDRAGNLYAVWSQSASAIYMVTSTDRGDTWSQPKRVSPPTMTGSIIMPWVVAGDPGRAAVAWYRGSMPGNPNSLANEWTIHMAQTLNALDPSPAFQTVQVSQNVIHRGEICLEGTLCDAEGRDRSFLEYPSIDMDSKGAAVIVYNDNTNQSEGPYVMLAKQATGPSLLASVGRLGTEPGAVTLSAPSPGTLVNGDLLTLEGTHTLPPKNFDRDEANDAFYQSAGAGLPGADLRSVALREQGDSLVVEMQVADLSSSAITSAASASQGTGLLYLTQWDYADTIYWLAAEMNGAQTSFYTGTLGMIRSATSKKFITYNPDLSKSQSLKGQVQGNTISITVPKVLVGSPVNGAPFHTVTGYALSERAPLLPIGADLPNAPAPAPKTTSLLGDPTSLPALLDASGAATYTAGDGGPLSDGVVEVSFDDPGFASPRAAAFSSDPTSSRWQLQLSAGDLAPGPHTAYVRQRIGGRAASVPVSVAFTVSDKVERDVTSLVTLDARNTSVLAGSVSYDLLLRNASAQTVYTPLAARVSKLTSASNGVTVANADNGQAGAGASFDYGGAVGGDATLAPNETTAARRLRFNNPSNEPFTVEFQIVGQLPRGSSAGGATTSGTSTSGGSNSAGTGSTSTSANGLVTSVLRVTYNPLLGTTTVERLK